MSYTREQRAANAAKAAMAAEQPITQVESVEPAPERDPTVKLESRNNPRDDVMKEILAAREAPAPEPEKIEDPVPPTPEEILAANTPDTPVETPSSPVEPVVEMVKVKIDGVESEVPKSEVEEAGGLVAYRTSKAADNRLAKVNQELAETKKLQAQMMQFLQAQQKPATPEITDDEFIKSKVDDIRFGTPEQSAAALREVMARANPKVDSNSLIQQAVSQMSRKTALDNFGKEFQDIVSNPIVLRSALGLEAERLSQANLQTDWPEFYRKIGNEVRSAFGRQPQPTASTTATPATGTPSTVSDKEARKSSIVNLPTAAARAALPTEPKPETREDTLNQLRKSRGIPTA